MPKKLLSEILIERTETIEFRAIRTQLMKFAQNKKRQFHILHIGEPALTMLRNEGLTIERINDGCEKWRISW